MAIIKTPDQRVRVFISSTINELADERKAAREAIGNLRLIPVFFEAGARPHPPRDLYSAYLEQSHIFLGIYWNSYGWVAPGAEISGLEDEYRLCENKKPKLIYVKKSDERQPRLNNLLADIEKSETACYQFFSDATELQKLIENDLSVLMSEIFENAIFDQQQTSIPTAQTLEIKHHKLIELPLIKSEIYGRDEDLKKVSELLSKQGVSLITLLGAGGTGKTTLSIHIADYLKDNFKDGVAFIPLAPVTDYNLVAPTIAYILGVNDSGKQPIEQTLIDFLIDKIFLLVLDNFEQVVDASKFISDIITRCKDVKVLVTSRTSLHIRNERIYNLSPLALPDENKTITPDELRNYPATQLFVERAMEVNPHLQFTRENTEAIIEICQRMDGLPLAIELAAARTRFFQPAALMSRIEKTLDLVSKGHKDLPERQQTLRGAIEWSYNLLIEDTQKIFRQLGVFKRSWTMESADVIINDGNAFVDVEEMMERLLDVSLIKPVLVSHSAEPRFNMLQTVHEYAKEMLEKSPEAQETKLRYANYYYDLCVAADGQLWIINSQAWLDKLEYEYQNIRAAYNILVETGNFEKAWNMFSILCSYWTVRGGFSETFQWIKDARINDAEFRKTANISKHIIARTLTWAGYCKLFLFQFEKGFAMLNEAEKIAEENNDEYAMLYANLFDGCYGSFMFREDAPAKMAKSLALAEKLNDKLALAMYYCWSYEYYRQQGMSDVMEKNLQRAHEIATEQGNIYIHGAIFILRFSIAAIDPNSDWEKIKQMGHELYNLLPEKGYKGLKAAAMMCIAYTLMMQDKLDEAEAPLMSGLEYSRVAGEMESNVYGSMEASAFFKMKGNDEKAYKIFGALDNFILISGYPLVGGSEAQYNMTKSKLEPDFELVQNKRWYEEGKKLRLEDAIVYALSK